MLVLLLLLPGYSLAQSVDPGPVQVGDRWSYEVKDSLTGDLRPVMTVVVADVNDKEITARVTLRGRDRPQTMIFDPDWGRIDDGAWKLTPEDVAQVRASYTGQFLKRALRAVRERVTS